jgi:tetratricopeptide (TPR) repeat protein
MRILIIIIVSLISIITKAQTTSKIRKLVQVLGQQNFELNGGIKAKFGGTSRVFYIIELPKNTIEWYYVFTATEKENSNPVIDLLPQLTKLYDPSGLTSVVASSIVSPKGTQSCDIYLMDRENKEIFMRQSDEYRYISASSRINFKSGTIPIKNNFTNNNYLCVRNPSATSGINVSIEVVAIVEETTIDNNVWSINNKERIEKSFVKYLIDHNADKEEAIMISSCMIDKITIEKTPNMLDKMTTSEKENYCHDKIAICQEELFPKLTDAEEKALTFGNLGWTAFEEGEIDKSILLSKKALKLDSSLVYVHANLGLCYLVKEDDEKSMDYYVEALTLLKKETDQKTKQESINDIIIDLKELMLKKPTLKNAQMFKKMFEDELE